MSEYREIYLKDYTTYPYDVKEIKLLIEFFEDRTIVESVLKVKKKNDTEDLPALVLNGEELETLFISVDGDRDYKDVIIKDTELLINPPSDSFEVATKVVIHPETNSSLQGIYKSGNFFCSQCEAEGFRKITWYPDRPDILSSFICTIRADKDKYPVLLSNGNETSRRDLEDGRHEVVWKDPFLKPSYLFAVVAGDLACLEDSFSTMSGRDIVLKIFSDHANIYKCNHAMNALKKAMKWDEDVFSREYDLDIYMIVAVNDFNMGAMENKGLNIFNSTYVLADPDSATDDDFFNIESVISHEYFHNWTGNRITLANWFQLSLKEGLTVFRDQQFSIETGYGEISRIKDVRVLKLRQFAEDAGPFSHPVRPFSYIEMNNFYTATVYEKGAEIVRMIYTWLGRETFLKGMASYFEINDGKAVCCEDFLKAVSLGSGVDIMPFLKWYEQSGTPHVKIEFVREDDIVEMKLFQKTDKSVNQDDKYPLSIPVKLAFIDGNGNKIKFKYKGENTIEEVVLLEKEKESFFFEIKESDFIPSLFRGFSAPVKYEAGLGMDDYIFLMSKDDDAFNRWDASRKVFLHVAKNLYNDFKSGKTLNIDESIFEAFSNILDKYEEDKNLTAEIISFPLENELIVEFSGSGEEIDPLALVEIRNFFISYIAERFESRFLEIYKNNMRDSYRFSSDDAASRKIKNVALFYLSHMDYSDFIHDIYKKSDNMTDTMAALKALSRYDDENFQDALSSFYLRWQNDPVVMDKWFIVQASSRRGDVLGRVISLMEDKLFSITNPNKVRSLIGAYTANPGQFHRKDGKGYAFLGCIISRLSSINPQIGARLVSSLSTWKNFESPYRDMMRRTLEDILKTDNLAKDIYEMVSKALV